MTSDLSNAQFAREMRRRRTGVNWEPLSQDQILHAVALHAARCEEGNVLDWSGLGEVIDHEYPGNKARSVAVKLAHDRQVFEVRIRYASLRKVVPTLYTLTHKDVLAATICPTCAGLKFEDHEQPDGSKIRSQCWKCEGTGKIR